MKNFFGFFGVHVGDDESAAFSVVESFVNWGLRIAGIQPFLGLNFISG